MRSLLPLLVLLLAACTEKNAPPFGPGPGTFVGEGRNRLCIAGAGDELRAGLIVYGSKAETNCSAVGKFEGSGDKWSLTPGGEGACKLSLSLGGDKLTIADVPASCSYYCAPGVTLTRKIFTRDPTASPASDLAGDPLC